MNQGYSQMQLHSIQERGRSIFPINLGVMISSVHFGVNAALLYLIYSFVQPSNSSPQKRYVM